VAQWFARRFRAPTEPQRRAWPVIQAGRHTLIAAPTGSGKTFAAFLAAVDALVTQGLAGTLAEGTQVLYVSPLKALSNDVQKNLAEPLAEIRRTLAELCLPDVEIRTLVRTGDTPAPERQEMVRRPPHILVTTPESLYLILTSARARDMLRTVRTVIVDEIHAVARDKRGSHLALSLERLAALTGRPLQRIGLSATQRPIEAIAAFLVGGGRDGAGAPECEIIDEGHARTLDLAIEIPSSPLEAVMAAEVWEEIYERLVALIGEHRTTLVFVNTRRLAERLTLHLSERLGVDQVTSHHGSLSKEKRLDAETRLKEGKLRALVATASLELGIDIGAVDLVCQIGSTRSIATFLQRVGRSGHHLAAVPKGRLFPLSRDELIECAALVRAARERKLDHLVIPEHPLDILAQQLVATVACEEWDEEALYQLVRGAAPYRDLTRQDFDAVVRMLADGFTTRRGRRGAYIHYDGVNRRLRARRGARLAAITSGGAIPDIGDYRVILEPTETFVGTLNEDFAIESMPGDIFQLGNTSYLIRKIESGQVRVEDARGQPPSIPFWLGEAPGRTPELSEEVSRLRQDIADRLADPAAAIAWLTDAVAGLPEPAARQMSEYLDASRKVLGVMPTQETLVLERFFDEAGGMQLVLHAPFGSRINRAWGLALRKRFCRSFNFELQAAATEDAIVLSLGPQHSFPLEDVFHYLEPETAEHLLVQAMLVAPMFGSRWRWNATRALAVLRARGGRKVPTPLQRMDAEDLIAAVFPDQLACPENLVGDRDIPDHPLVKQTIADCLLEAMDFPGLKRVLEAVAAGRCRLVARDTTEPSPLAHEVLNAKPYAFLDDAPLEERRTQAVITRRGLDVKTAEEFGKLDQAAIDRVKAEAWPEPASADELHDALLVMGCVPERETGGGPEGGAPWRPYFEELTRAGRAGRLLSESPLWVAAERVPLVAAVFPGIATEPALTPPERDRAQAWTREDAVRELVRGRLEAVGPTTAAALAGALGVGAGDVEFALGALEHEGFVLRGRFTPGVAELEWCERRLLARIHRYTLDRLRAEIEPVTAADFMRFLCRWQRVTPGTRAEGPEGLAAVLELLDGYEVAAGAWETDVLPARVAEYDPLWLDGLCLSGEVAWGRLAPVAPANGHKSGPIRTTPIALFRRERGEVWRSLAAPPDPAALPLAHAARAVLEVLDERGASFFGDVVNATGLLRTEVEKGLAELVAWGLVTSDSFAGLRALLVPSERRRPIGGFRRRGRIAPFGVETAGRWSRVRQGAPLAEDRVAEAVAWQLLRRYGVVFRRLVTRETLLVPWRDVLRVYRRLEARGEVRGGRFVGGVSGEQYALAEAVGLLRAVRREAPTGELVVVSGADPLNVVGILTPGDVVTALATNRILYRDGIPVAVKEGEGRGERFLADVAPDDAEALRTALVRGRAAPLVRSYLGKTRARPTSLPD
ncbi:MAG TPA: DEAD/DEAH box helicase, partial [Gemmatimonadales bacterium]|nr:DEAD/DEAH box helicase [Gemmatimonadales bacterium]